MLEWVWSSSTITSHSLSFVAVEVFAEPRVYRLLVSVVVFVGGGTIIITTYDVFFVTVRAEKTKLYVGHNKRGCSWYLMYSVRRAPLDMSIDIRIGR